tara:strand:+ start:2044 stop:2238 length:195 start_codon:yes stop_codon:yes gene_type:complete
VKRIGPMFMILGVINGGFSLIQGFMIPPELQHEFSISAKEYFLYSFVLFALGLRMCQKAKELDE